MWTFYDYSRFILVLLMFNTLLIAEDGCPI